MSHQSEPTDHAVGAEEACARHAEELLVALSVAGVRTGPYSVAAFAWEVRGPAPGEPVWIERHASLGWGFEVRGVDGFYLHVRPPRPKHAGGLGQCSWGTTAHVTVFVRFDPADPDRASRLHSKPAARLAAAGLWA